MNHQDTIKKISEEVIFIFRKNLIEDIKSEKKSLFRNFINPNDLSGACAIVSFLVCKNLCQYGYDAKLIIGKYDSAEHCWVEVHLSNKKIIVDPTFSQFANSKSSLFIFEKSDPQWKLFKKSSSNDHKDPKLIRKFRFWPTAQRPIERNIRKIINKKLATP